MAINKLPQASTVSDQQFVKVVGPDGVQSGFQYDNETKTFYIKDNQVVIPSFHGQSHISEDPIPDATTDLHGLMSADDKAKLDALLQTRIGVLGFQGAGFPDDGGWMMGDIILSAGSEFISLERIGKVVRFTVDSPIQFASSCLEECAQIYWIQDETDTASIRPPSCAGRLPGVNGYGEFKIYAFPKNTVVTKANVAQVLRNKGNYPAFIFKRYDDAIAPGTAEHEMVLQRNTDTTTRVGWAMTPGPFGVPECVWFTGHDDDGQQIRFEFSPNSEPGLLGALLYQGHTLTRQMAVITDYTASVLTSNQYVCKFWDVNGAKVIDDPNTADGTFVATNIWRYQNPENATTDLANPKALVTDASTDLLTTGTLVEIWEFLIGESSDIDGKPVRIVRRYFRKEPNLNPSNVWAVSGAIRFGDVLAAKSEIQASLLGSDITANEDGVEDVRLFERFNWGITGFEDPLLVADDGQTTDSIDLAANITAVGAENGLLPLPNVSVSIDGGPYVVNAYSEKALIFTTILSGREFIVLQNTTDDLVIGGIGPSELDAAITAAGGLPVPFNIFTETNVVVPSGVPVNNRNVANIDYTRPGLLVEQLPPLEDRERPVYLWHRDNHKNVYLKALVGTPTDSKYPPIDVLLRAPIDSFDDVYMQVISRGTIASGTFADMEYIRITGVDWKDLPKQGTLRTLTGIWRDRVWKYYHKLAFGSPVNGSQIMLIGAQGDPFLFDDDFVPGDSDQNPSSFEVATTPNRTTIVELLHEDYTSPCLRIEFSVNNNSGAESVQLQLKGGILDTGEPYEIDVDLPEDNYVRGMRPGAYSVSKIYTQDGFITTGVETPAVDTPGFIVYDGGAIPAAINGQTELWNTLEVMLRDSQLWVWWNGLLVSPDATLSADLPTPVAITTPYFPIDFDFPIGKVGLRLWPGAVVRELEIRDNNKRFNEYIYGQLELGSGSTGTSS